MERDLESEKQANVKQLLRHMKQQIALANAQELLSNMTTKCFEKCINRPANSLSSYEQRCIIKCMDRYMDSYRLVSRTYGHRLQRERQHM